MPERPGIDGPEGEPGEGAAHVVELIVAVDGAHHREAGTAPQEGAHHVGPAAVAVDELVAALFDIRRQLAAEAGDVVAAHDLHRDAEGAGLLGKGTVPEADQLGGDGLVEVSQQAEDVGLGPAGVAAADEMYGFHGGPPMTADKFRSLFSCPAGADCGILTLT